MGKAKISKCMIRGTSVKGCRKKNCWLRNVCLFSNSIASATDVKRTNLQKLKDANLNKKKEMLIDFFTKWAGIGDSYIYDLTRVKEAFSVGTISIDDFVEWDEKRIGILVDELLEWLMREA